MSKFWRQEKAEKVESSKIKFRLYKDSGKLQIDRFTRYGGWQYVTLDKRAITPEMITIFKKFISQEEKEGK
jgi:hypothetical protein